MQKIEFSKKSLPTTTDVGLINHDCVVFSEVVFQEQRSVNVVKKRRICKICSRIWVTTETCKGYLTESMDGTQAKIWTIIETVSNIYGVSKEELLGPSRNRSLSLARQVAMYLAKEAGYSLPKIGEIFNRHHTTIMYGCNHVEERIQKDGHLKGLIKVIKFKDQEVELNKAGGQ